MNRKFVITLEDKKTNIVKNIEYEWEGSDEGIDFYFKEGNLSCDCNRYNLFYDDADPDYPCGHERFKLLGIEEKNEQ